MMHVEYDGGVYVDVPVESFALLKATDAALCVWDESAKDYVVARRAPSIDDRLYLRVGNLNDMNMKRNAMFKDVRDFADYARKHGCLPWGWRGICRCKKWKRVNVGGVSIAISDGIHVVCYNNKKKTATIIDADSINE